jgi:hypothetical protein
LLPSASSTAIDDDAAIKAQKMQSGSVWLALLFSAFPTLEMMHLADV